MGETECTIVGRRCAIAPPARFVMSPISHCARTEYRKGRKKGNRITNAWRRYSQRRSRDSVRTERVQTYEDDERDAEALAGFKLVILLFTNQESTLRGSYGNG